MANMSYCRFQNTYQDFEDCKGDLLERYMGDAEEHLSIDEKSAAEFLLDSMADLFIEIGVDVDDEQLAHAKKALGLK